MEIPPIGYAAFNEGHIAWQSWGDAAQGVQLTLLDMGVGMLASIDAVPDEPRLLRWVEGLATLGRLLRYDNPGVGLSDEPSDGPGTLVLAADAGLAVMDAADAAKVVVVGSGAHAMVAMHLAHRHPNRVSGMVLINPAARWTEAPDYPYGVPADQVAGMLEATDPSAVRAEGQAVADIDIMAPSAAGDPAFRAWWQRTSRRGATPRVAGPINRDVFSSDLRPLLPQIAIPTLVIHRRDLPFGTGPARVVGELLPHATVVEVPGPDLMPFVGDSRALLDEIRQHLTGHRHAAVSDRVFAAVLFTDVVESTAQATRLGDERWGELLQDHLRLIQAEVLRHGGVLVADTGDGSVCTFGSPGGAIRCALELVARAPELGLQMRAGVHAGEIEMRGGGNIAGINVHLGARVSALAQAGEVLVSTTVVDLVAGSSFGFTDRGVHQLKGIDGARQVWAVVAGPVQG